MRILLSLLLVFGVALTTGSVAWSQSSDDRPSSGSLRSKSRKASKRKRARAKARRAKKRKKAARRLKRGKARKASRRSGAKGRSKPRVKAKKRPKKKTEPSLFQPNRFQRDGKQPLVESVPEVSSARLRGMFVNAVATEPAPKPQLLVAEANSGVPEGRKASALTPDAASRWSNIGAIEPVESEVPLQAPLPERNLPRPVGVATAGQRLRGDENNVFSARVSLSASSLSVLNQPNWQGVDEGVADPLQPSDQSRDVQLLRARVTGAYERIGGSQFSTHLDVEVRPRLNGDGRFDNQRLNAAYIGWGLQGVQPKRRDDPSVGISVGRLAVREAGFAQADGLLLRGRVAKGVDIGAFGGVTGNPYGFNWIQRIDESFSTNWVTGGGFGSFRGRQLQVSVAGVVTAATAPSQSTTGELERVYAHTDVAWQPSSTVSIFASGYFDFLPGGQTIQNGDLALAWSPQRFNFRVSAGRFSTIVYEGAIIAGGTAVDPLGATSSPDVQDEVIVNQDNQVVTPFDGAVQVASYYNFRVSGGYRLARSLEAYLRVNTMIRDTNQSQLAVAAAINDQGVDRDQAEQFSPVRFTPALGVRFQEPKIINVDGEAMFIQDDQAQTDMVLRFGLGRGLGGLFARADGRVFFGDIDGYDGGFQLAYSVPRSWSVGFLQFSASLRYYRENSLNLIDFGGQNGALGPNAIQVINNQETLLGFVGLEWRR